MKAVDTPLLLALLEGRPEAEGLLEGLSGEEICTSEVNLFELEAIARASPAAGRRRRLTALERLRHKVTVLPIDERSCRAAATLASTNRLALPGATWLVLGAFEANGASEVLTTEASSLSAVKGALKVTVIRRRRSKNR